MTALFNVLFEFLRLVSAPVRLALEGFYWVANFVKVSTMTEIGAYVFTAALDFTKPMMPSVLEQYVTQGQTLLAGPEVAAILYIVGYILDFFVPIAVLDSAVAWFIVAWCACGIVRTALVVKGFVWASS